MSRPRIRTLKPENWSDEAVGALSRDARLLRDVLITYADDDGRWRHLLSAIIGFGYAYDDDVSPADIRRWTDETISTGLVIVYEVDGTTYGCFPRWHLHQVIPKYKPSDLPPCDHPRVLTRQHAARIKAGELPSSDGSRTGLARYEDDPHAGAPASAPLRSLSDVVDAPARAEATDPLATIDDERLAATVTILRTSSRLRLDCELMGVANALTAHKDLDHVKAAHRAIVIANAKDWTDADAGRVLWMAFEDQGRKPRNGSRPATASEPSSLIGLVRDRPEEAA